MTNQILLELANAYLAEGIKFGTVACNQFLEGAKTVQDE